MGHIPPATRIPITWEVMKANMNTRYSVSPLSGATGVRIDGVDANEDFDAETRKLLYALYLSHGLLLLRDQHLSPEQHIAFSRLFGDLEIHPIEKIRLPNHPEIIELTNRGAKVSAGKQDDVLGRIPWHSDLTYTLCPSRGALLYARIVPEEGGQTAFVDTAAVYDGLDEATKRRIDRLEVVHSIATKASSDLKEDPVYDRPPGDVQGHDAAGEGAAGQPKGVLYEAALAALNTPEFPEVIHPLVFTHPESGRKALNISPLFAKRILGLPDDEGQHLLRELIEYATESRHVYMHNWKVGDLIIWDNWRTMHAALGCKPKFLRVMHRTTISADGHMGRIAA